MAPATLRRHLAALVDGGLIIRRDSPNGKRYARKGRGGDIELAFGFDLSPLVARADEFEVLAEEVRAEERALKLVRERITICRRDIAKMIATGMEENVPVHCAKAAVRRTGSASTRSTGAFWPAFRARRPVTQLEPVAEELSHAR